MNSPSPVSNNNRRPHTAATNNNNNSRPTSAFGSYQRNNINNNASSSSMTSSPSPRRQHRRQPMQLPLIFSNDSASGIQFSKSVLNSHTSAYPQDRPGDTGAAYCKAPGPGHYNLDNVVGGSDARNTKETVSMHRSKWLGGIDANGLSQVSATRLSTLTRREQRMLLGNEIANKIRSNSNNNNRDEMNKILTASLLMLDYTQQQQTKSNAVLLQRQIRQQQEEEDMRRQIEEDEIFFQSVEKVVAQGKARNEVEMSNRRKNNRYLVYRSFGLPVFKK
jgi:hypothetical protein